MIDRTPDVVRRCAAAIFLTFVSSAAMAQFVESAVYGDCVNTSFPSDPTIMIPGVFTKGCNVTGAIIGYPGNDYVASAKVEAGTGYSDGQGQAAVEASAGVASITAQSGSAGASGTAIVEYYAGLAISKPPPIPRNYYIPIKMTGQYGGYGFGSLSSWGGLIRMKDWDSLTTVYEHYLPEPGTTWPPVDPNKPVLPVTDYIGTALIADSAIYQIHVDAWCNVTVKVEFVSQGVCGAYADPVISLDQAAFDEQMGTDTFNLADYYELVFSPEPVPVPAAVWLFGSALLGLTGIGRRRSRN